MARVLSSVLADCLSDLLDVNCLSADELLTRTSDNPGVSITTRAELEQVLAGDLDLEVEEWGALLEAAGGVLFVAVALRETVDGSGLVKRQVGAVGLVGGEDGCDDEAGAPLAQCPRCGGAMRPGAVTAGALCCDGCGAVARRKWDSDRRRR